MFVIHFCGLQYVKQKCILSFFKISGNLYFFLQTDYFKCNWLIKFPGEIVVDIVLGVSENSQSTSTVKFLVKLQPAKMGFVNSFRLKFSPDFLNSEKLSRGDLQE